VATQSKYSENTVKNLINSFYEHLSFGDSVAAQEKIEIIEGLDAPESLVNSLYFVLESYSQEEGEERPATRQGEYCNSKIMRGVKEKAPSTRMEICPLVSIIVVSYNSSRELKELLPSITNQTYKNWEVILVENGTEDNRDLLADHIETHTYMHGHGNLGYAEGNNMGASVARGEYLLLLNPDTRLDSDAIKELLRGLTRKSNQSLAACPKIYFYREFIRIWVKDVPSGCSISMDSLVKNLDYKKMFLREGLKSMCGSYIWPSSERTICFDIPCPQGQETITLLLTKGETGNIAQKDGTQSRATVYVGDDSEVADLIEVEKSLKIKYSTKITSASRRLINNAGSGINRSGMPFDRGFGEEDTPDYSVLTHVDAFCGCCVLIHRITWVARKLFFPFFFAYFEDTELSHWIKRHHYQILYCPTSIVYHRHSETTQERSPSWNYLVNRSSTLYKWITGKIADAGHAEKLISGQPTEGVDPNLLSAISATYPTSTISSLQRTQKRDKITVAIYNSYWSTKGGGEKHALDIAAILSQSEQHEIYLLSDRNFDVNELAEYFQLDLGNCTALRLDEVIPLTTGFFDVFINSTYRSTLISRAPKSFYIVSFPTRTLPEHVLDSYTFLHNSEFTQEWARKYWGEHQGLIVHPILGCERVDNSEIQKKKVIASVGRFNYAGHCKNQHLLIKAFYKAKEVNFLANDWHLVIAGSVNNAEITSVSHYQDCKSLVRDESVLLLPNARRTMITSLYREAFAYIHCTGLDVDIDMQPEMCEHFGISVFEAVSQGCIPFVHNSGGAKDILKLAGIGRSFRSLDELVACLEGLDSHYTQYEDRIEGILPIQTANRAKEAIEDSRLAIIKALL